MGAHLLMGARRGGHHLFRISIMSLSFHFIVCRVVSGSLLLYCCSSVKLARSLWSHRSIDRHLLLINRLSSSQIKPLIYLSVLLFSDVHRSVAIDLMLSSSRRRSLLSACLFSNSPTTNPTFFFQKKKILDRSISPFQSFSSSNHSSAFWNLAGQSDFNPKQHSSCCGRSSSSFRFRRECGGFHAMRLLAFRIRILWRSISVAIGFEILQTKETSGLPIFRNLSSRRRKNPKIPTRCRWIWNPPSPDAGWYGRTKEVRYVRDKSHFLVGLDFPPEISRFLYPSSLY